MNNNSRLAFLAALLSTTALSVAQAQTQAPQANSEQTISLDQITVTATRGEKQVLDVPGTIDMVTFYVPPEVGRKVMVDVARKGIAEVWLNPGSESDELLRLAREHKIEPIMACSILGIGENPYA